MRFKFAWAWLLATALVWCASSPAARIRSILRPTPEIPSPPKGRESSGDLSGRGYCYVFSTQGIGLRPRPWAEFSRPVGPEGVLLPF